MVDLQFFYLGERGQSNRNFLQTITINLSE